MSKKERDIWAMINRVWRTHNNNNNNKSQFIILNEMKQENLFFVYISVSRLPLEQILKLFFYKIIPCVNFSSSMFN
jgi:hypothetical protein